MDFCNLYYTGIATIIFTEVNVNHINVSFLLTHSSDFHGFSYPNSSCCLKILYERFQQQTSLSFFLAAKSFIFSFGLFHGRGPQGG